MTEASDRIADLARDARLRELAGADDGSRLRLLAAVLPLRLAGSRQARRAAAALRVRDAERLLAGDVLIVRK